MLTLPPIPAWPAMHPLIIHFPIVLLLVAPLFIVIGLMRKGEFASPFFLAALLLMTLGTGSTDLPRNSLPIVNWKVLEIHRN